MSASSELRYDVKVSGLLPAAGEPMPNGEPPRWSPLSHTLIHGPTEAVLVDPPITVAQTAVLADWIAAFGKRLAYVYITHWHADHWLGTSELVARFPGAVVYASDATVTRIARSTPDGVPAALWASLFPGQLPAAPIPLLARPVPADGFTVDGHPLVAVEAGHSDTDDTTVLHAPSISLVAAGDVVYNNVHQYLAETSDGGLEGWHRALDVVASLRPAHVVAGHKDAPRDDAPANIAETRRYLDCGLATLPYGPGASVANVTGSAQGGGYEWHAAASAAPLLRGNSALLLDGSGKISRYTVIYDSYQFSSARYHALASLNAET